MDIDLPFWLTILSFISGSIYALDYFYLAPRRIKSHSLEVASVSKKTKSTEGPEQEAIKEPLVVEYAKSLFPVFFLVLIIRSFIGESFVIPSESMVPTFKVGDFLIVSKFSYGLRLPITGIKIIEVGEPERGDIAVFQLAGDSKRLIKRVVGLPGDKISYINKRLYINGEVVQEDRVATTSEELTGTIADVPKANVESYISYLDDVEYRMQKFSDRSSRLSDQDTWFVPEAHYFVMGDSRDNSYDSRFWGMVPDHALKGRAWIIWMHKPPGLNIPSFERNAIIR